MQSLWLLLIVVVPGAAASFGFERYVVPISRDTTDRVIRYVVGTALLAPFSLWVVWIVWTKLLHVRVPTDPPTFENRLETARNISPVWLALPIAYLVLPWVSGLVVGRCRNRYFRWILERDRTMPDSDPVDTEQHQNFRTRVRGWFATRFRNWLARRRNAVPAYMTSWEHLFIGRGPMHVSVRMKDGKWVGGLYAADSFASPLAATNKEMVLEARLEVDADGVVIKDHSGIPNIIGGAVRVCAADVDLITVDEGESEL